MAGVYLSALPLLGMRYLNFYIMKTCHPFPPSLPCTTLPRPDVLICRSFQRRPPQKKRQNPVRAEAAIVLAGRPFVATSLGLSGFVRSCGLWNHSKEACLPFLSPWFRYLDAFLRRTQVSFDWKSFFGRERGGVVGPSVAVSGPWGLM